MASESSMKELMTMFKEQMAMQQEQHRASMEALLAVTRQSSQQGQGDTATVFHIPHFAAFDEKFELWTDYYSRFLTFVSAHSVPKEKQAKVFLTNQSSVNYKMIDNMAKQLNPPKDVNTLTLDEVSEFMKEHYHPKRFIVRERYKFWSEMRRKPGETIQELAARIRQDAVTCDFPSITNPQDEAMRTRFMCSLDNEAVLKSLFKMKDDELTFAKAIEVAGQIEDAAKCAKETVYGEKDSMHKVKRQNQQGRKYKYPKKTAPATVNKRDFPAGTCGRCGNKHPGKDCRFKTAVCHYCKKTGHIERVCLQKSRGGSVTKRIETVSTVKTVKAIPHLMVDGKIKDKTVKFELDTGAGENFISSQTWNLLGRPKLQPVASKFESATKHPLPTLGLFQETVELEDSKPQHISFVVTEMPNLNILGRSGMKELNISVDHFLHDIKKLENVQPVSSDSTLEKACKDLCAEFPNLFSEELGLLKGFELDIKFKEDAKPVFCKPRAVPFALQEDLEAAYDAGIAKGVWKPTTFSSYGTPVVPVRKRDSKGQPTGQIRVCGDYSVSVNPQLAPHRHPIPSPEDLMRKLGGGQYFSKIDLAEAYNQIQLSPASQEKLALNTHRGVLLQQRLPFGITSAPGYFQEVMDKMTKDLKGVAVYMDDMLVGGTDANDHLQNLRALLKRLEDRGLRCRLEKCEFAKQSVQYLGHRLSHEGIAKGSKVDAVINMPPPSSVSELRAFLGQVQFYGKFLPNLSTVLDPLYRLTRKDTPWCWSAEEQKSFQHVKDLLCTDMVLAHFDPSLDLGISCDASDCGLGAVLFHRYPDGSERPIAKTLSSTQRKYSQIHREALAIIFALSKFHQFVYGRKFTLITDHKPLLTIFSPKKGTPTMAANRLARWALTLSQYEYDIEYRKSSQHGNADALSRLPSGPDTDFDMKEEGADMDSVCTIKTISCQLTPTDPGVVKKESEKDPNISTVMRYCREGWPMSQSQLLPEQKTYWQIKDSLSSEAGCLFYGARLVIPNSLHQQVSE